MNDSEKQKINILSPKDLDISYYIGSGAGGQNRQKNATGVKLVHRESGAIGQCSETRSREQNKKKAFQNLVNSPKMKLWLNKKMYEIRNQETLEEFVDNWMSEKNLKIEGKDEEGKWTRI